MPANFKSFLVCRTDAIGDTLLTLPVAAALKRAWPRARVTFLASAYTADILLGQPGLDEVWIADGPGRHRDLPGRIRQGGFDAALMVFPDRRISWAVWRAGVPVRVGTGRRWWSCLYSVRVAVSRAQGTRHEADFNLDLVRALGVEAVLQPPRLRLPAQAVSWARAYLQSRGLKPGERLIAVHPGGRGSAANWPREHYRDLVLSLVRWPQTKVLLTGSQAEQGLLASLARGCKRAPLVLQEAVSLKQLTALLARARLLVSGNTGPMHLAAGMRTPTLAFFPPQGVTGPGRWQPLGNRQVILTPVEHAGKWDMRDITVENALQAAARLAGGPKS